MACLGTLYRKGGAKGITMTTVKDGLYQYGGVPVGGLLSQGKAYHIKPRTGASGGGGLKLNDAISTVSGAHALMTADQNDVAYFYSEDNSASGCTDYQSSALTWSKDCTHLVGVNSGGIMGQRSRIAQLSTATAVTPLVTWSASGGSMSGIHIFHGVADATSKQCFSVTGERNYFSRCHFAGIGNTLMDVATAASLVVSGDENLFEDCVIGLDTIGRGSAANSEILFTGQATRNVFRRCIVPTFADANTHQFIIAGASSLDRYALFEDCLFVNPVDSTATSMTEAIDASASAGGSIILRNCTLVGAADWEANVESGITLIDGAAPTNNTSGLAVNVEAT